MTDAHNWCMVDIETLGTDPDAAIVSVGAVRFSTDGLGEEFFRSVDIQSCEDAGLSIDGETLDWWWSQSDDAREQLSGGDELADVLEEFATFYDGCKEIWAKDPDFDCLILEHAFEACAIETPWSHWDCRSVRTRMDTPFAERLPHDGVAHNALDDAKKQARNVAATTRRMRDE